MSARAMAERTTILRVTVGSTAHGLALVGTDDRDEMGICVEDMHAAMGFSPFEQYIYRTAAEREGRHDAPSQPGDLDLVIYSLRKFLGLALRGNPTILIPLFAREWHIRDARGQQLQELTPQIVSRQAGRRFLGYMQAQRERLLGVRGQKRIRRPELVEQHGYDTKYAMHLLRLGVQGKELLETGQLTLPMDEASRSQLMAVRQGRVELSGVIEWAEDLEARVTALLDTSPLPEHPDTAAVQEWMLGVYLNAWATTACTKIDAWLKEA
ncbi:MAG: nucleotidyltransferase domain-containing protein [Polyangiaceae bacterium]|nr:nucleotidyltransferase domain-containing protein [Polyangiaceae bacterium]